MIIGLIPTKLVNKYQSKQILDAYFGADSIEELILLLRNLRRKGYLDFDVRIKDEYFKWQRNKTDLKLRTDVLNHPDPFGLIYRDEHGLNARHSSVNSDTPLSDNDSIKIATALPPDLAEKYVEIKIFHIDRDELNKIAPKRKQTRPKLGEVSYKGLKIADAQVSYNGKTITMPFQEREVLRMLIEKKESLVFYGTFEQRTDLADPSNASTPREAISKLISRVRLKLKKATKQNCIHNTPQEGWTLKID
ncbi:hypothetical protein JNM87_01920 [Candidatus Saccharibacteria bacterium]|nr:hypothetical protein [Candidatus Saccharibacteria bacterium]